MQFIGNIGQRLVLFSMVLVASTFLLLTPPAMAANISSLTSYAQFKDLVNSNKTVVIESCAEWSGPCRVISPIYEKIAGANSGTLTFTRVNVDDQPDISQDLGIRALPTYTAFKNGQKIKDFVGANPPGLASFIQTLTP